MPLIVLIFFILFTGRVYSPTCEDAHASNPSICEYSIEEWRTFASSYGASIAGTGGDSPYAAESNMYPNYEERYIQHHWNIVRYDCHKFVSLGYTNTQYFQTAVADIVCDSNDIDQWPTEPVHYHPRLNEASRYHAHDLNVNRCSLQHDSCDGTGTWTRINSFLGPGCGAGGEILWSPINYKRAVDGWLCERSSSSGCYVGGHTQITMKKGYTLGGPGVEAYINGDWSSCNVYDRNEVPIHSAIYRDFGGDAQFIAMFYGPDLTDISGVVRIAGTSHPLVCDIQRNEFPGSGHFSTTLTGITTDCSVKFKFEFTAKDSTGATKTFGYPVSGSLYVGEQCDPQYISEVCATDCTTLSHASCDESAEPPVCKCEPGWSTSSGQDCDCVCWNGQCDSGGTCNCGQGWKGTLCDEPFCFETCHHGSCDLTVAPPACKCDSGWQGASCEVFHCGEEGCVNGVCTGPNKCSCFGGYTGDHCDIIACDGIEQTDDAVCNKHGQCTGPDVCVCEQGWNGVFCGWKIIEGIQCYGLDSSNPLVCSGRGGCVKQDVCKCDDGWYGYNKTHNWCNLKRSCFGVDYDNFTVCGGVGKCLSQDKCQCPSVFSTHSLADSYAGSECQHKLMESQIGIATVTSGIVICGLCAGVVFLAIVFVVLASFIKAKKGGGDGGGSYSKQSSKMYDDDEDEEEEEYAPPSKQPAPGFRKAPPRRAGGSYGAGGRAPPPRVPGNKPGGYSYNY